MQYRLNRDGFLDPAPPPDRGSLLRLHEKLFAGRWWDKN
jgi:hypothetical protein